MKFSSFFLLALAANAAHPIFDQPCGDKCQKERELRRPRKVATAERLSKAWIVSFFVV